jgi:hypothetical protein
LILGWAILDLRAWILRRDLFQFFLKRYALLTGGAHYEEQDWVSTAHVALQSAG